MGIMNFLRNRAGIIIIILIGFAIVAFLLGDVMTYGTPFWNRQQNQVGSINGNSIDYEEFKVQYDQRYTMFSQQMGGSLNPQMESVVTEQVWNEFVGKVLLNEEIEKIGLTVSNTELNELVTGENPAYVIRQNFTDPNTGQFERGQLLNFAQQVKDLPANNEARQQWELILDNVINERLNEKYTNLINNSVYVTSLEANEEYTNRNRLANFDYVLLDYNSIPDNEVTISDADYKEYYNENKAVFFNKTETRSIEYVVVDARPVAQDTLNARESIEQLTSQLRESTTDSLFAAVNSENKFPYAFMKRGQLPVALDSAVFNVSVGSTVGPILSNGVFYSAKITDTRVGPDSVKASHILLNPATEGGQDAAQKKADSIRNLARSGESFAALAIEFSTDEGSKINGGELGTFGRGAMIPAFENAVFDARVGDVLTVSTQFGIHIIKVENQIGSSRVVKAAIIDKAVNSGRETLDNAYNKATQFFSAVNKDNFSEVATEQGLTAQRVDNVNALAGTFNNQTVPRELVRWAFDANKGAITDKIFESENSYIVARVTGIQKEGQLPLEDVKRDIEGIVRNRAKAKKLIEQAQQAASGASSLAQIATKLGKEAIAAENIVFANPVIPGVAQENSVVGTVFGLQPKKPSAPIRGNQGVYLVEVAGFVNPAAPSDINAQKRQIQQSAAQRTWSQVYRALQDAADINDNRAKFY